jgi:uncharacterized protein (TIGR03083 family)
MDANAILMYGHLWVLKHLEGLTDEQWQQPGVCGVWSTKDIVAHLASFEWVLADVLLGFVDPGPTPTLDQYLDMDGDAFNAAQVERRKRLAPAQTLAEYNAGYERVMELLPRLPEGLLQEAGRLAWYGDEYALDDLIVYQYYGHKREHMAQVAVYRDTLKR